MSRKYIVRIREVLRLRAQFWEWHYQTRQWAQISGWEVGGVLWAIGRYVPPLTLDACGRAIEYPLGCQRSAFESLNKPYVMLTPPSNCYEVMNAWYWSEEGWMDFVRQFNALPDVTEDHYLYYDAERDLGLTVPLSYGKGSGETTGKLRGNSGETTGKLGEFPRARARKSVSVPR